MSLWQRVRAVWQARRLEEDLDAELAFHLEEKERRLREEQGLSPEAAHFEAQRSFGNSGQWRERTRSLWRFGMVDSVFADVRYALRGWRRQPGFFLTAAITLALGIGANAAVFSLFNALLLRPVAVPRPGNLVLVYAKNLPRSIRQWEGGAEITTRERRMVSYPMYAALAKRQDLFDGLYVIAGQGDFAADWPNAGTQKLNGQLVSGNFFAVLGVSPAAGRLFTDEDDRPGAGADGWPVVVSEAFAFRQFGRPSEAIGRKLQVERVPAIVVGVVPASFPGVNPGERRDLWLPNEMAAALWGGKWKQYDWSMNYAVGGRLRDGLSLQQADQQLQASSPAVLEPALPPSLGADERAAYLDMRLGLRNGSRGDSWMQRQFGEALWVLLAAVQLVLLIACSNVANLMLARGLSRRREMAMRLALGAKRGRLLRQLLTESVVLAAVAVALGVVLARWLSVGILYLALGAEQGATLQVESAALDLRMLLFLCGMAGATVLLFGVFPALAASGTQPQEALKQQQGGPLAAPGLWRRGLVVLQVALTMTLVACAGLFVGTLRSLLGEDAQTNRAQVVVLRPDLVNAGVNREQIPEWYEWLKREVDRLPQVQASAWTQMLPLDGGLIARTVDVPGRPDLTNEQRFVFWHEVGPGYFETLHLPVLEGRGFAQRDMTEQHGRAQVVLSERTAQEFFGSHGPVVGRTLGLGDGVTADVIGVVADAKYQSLRSERPRTVYALYAQKKPVSAGLQLLVRTNGDDGEQLAAAARSLLRQRLGKTPLLKETTLAETALNSVRREWLLACLLSAFAAMALTIAAVGLYGLVRYIVTSRRRDLAIRLCLGANAGRIVSGLLGEAAVLVLLGVAVGLAAAYVVGRAVAAYLYGVHGSDPGVLGGACVVLLAMGLTAAVGPALRARRLDPMQVLREE